MKKININNSKKWLPLLESANKGLRKHQLSYQNLLDSVKKSTDKLNKMVPKKYHKGTKLVICTGTKYAGKFKGYGSGAVYVSLKRGTKDWFITEIERIYNNKEDSCTMLFLTCDAKNYLLEQYKKQLTGIEIHTSWW